MAMLCEQVLLRAIWRGLFKPRRLEIELDVLDSLLVLVESFVHALVVFVEEVVD